MQYTNGEVFVDESFICVCEGKGPESVDAAHHLSSLFFLVSKQRMNVALSAVLVSSKQSTQRCDEKQRIVKGPDTFSSISQVVEGFANIGFQASNVGEAVRLLRLALQPQLPSVQYAVQNGEFVRMEAPAAEEEGPTLPVIPHLFFGMTAHLFATGCREALVFLLREGLVPKGGAGSAGATELACGDQQRQPQSFGYEVYESLGLRELRKLKPLTVKAYGSDPIRETGLDHYSFLCCVVVSGGAMEHDIRRACEPYYIGSYASERKEEQPAATVAFGNLQRASDVGDDGKAVDSLYRRVMTIISRRVREAQAVWKADADAVPQPIDPYYDTCTWSFTPSEVWQWVGLWLPHIFTEALSGLPPSAPMIVSEEALKRARSTAVYWAAQQGVPTFSPSFADGDIVDFLQPPLTSSSAAAGACEAAPSLLLDLVRDIHSVNKMAMTAKHTAMLICGGGVVKHHICNANLMRNGADISVFINNGQEYDGSDAGAKPEEALSWGKIRFDGKHVKVYSEVTVVLPLLVADVFVKAVRERNASSSPLSPGGEQ